jgi:hypothetical protein
MCHRAVWIISSWIVDQDIAQSTSNKQAELGILSDQAYNHLSYPILTRGKGTVGEGSTGNGWP